jgi:hypothetical protein
VGRIDTALAFQRGSILVESAIVTSSILVLMLGMLQMGLLGFLQVTLDAGAFLNAHQNAIGVTDTLGPSDATHQVFPQIQASSIANTVQTAPSPLVPVNYGYNGNAAQQAASATSRHGGSSVMQPYLSQTTISQTPFTIFGHPFIVHSQASEANWLETMPSWGIANSNYGGAYSASNTQYSTNVFTLGENTPPYFMGANFFTHCTTPGVWGAVGSTAGRGVCAAPGSTTSTSRVIVLGIGEFLDTTNWANGVAGVGGPVGSPGGASTGTFEAAACHQRMFATLAYFFENLTENNYGNSGAFATDPLNYLETTYNPYYYNRTGYTDFSSTNASFFGQWPNGATHHTLDTQTTAAIQTIYGWDDQAGYQGSGGLYGVGNNPLHATAGCT